MNEVEQALVALGRELEFPQTPDLAPRVRARISERRRALGRRPLAIALATLAVAFGAAMAVPQARTAILRFFRIGGVTIVRVETLPPAEERPLTAPLGTPVALDRVYDRTGIEPLLPPGERPSHAYVFDQVVSFVFRVHGKPVLLTEIAGGGFVKKALVEETRVEAVRVNDRPGYWLAGKRHVVRVLETPPRLVGNVLIWQHDDLTLRLEGPLARDDALELARAIR